jgi:hypothetical protein
VGHVRDHPYRLCELVGGISKRLVLNATPEMRLAGLFRSGLSKREY